jgi:hypothetical protein
MGFASLKFLQRGQRLLEEPYIEVYGGYSTRLMRLQIDLIQALDKHRRGPKQTVPERSKDRESRQKITEERRESNRTGLSPLAKQARRYGRTLYTTSCSRACPTTFRPKSRFGATSVAGA